MENRFNEINNIMDNVAELDFKITELGFQRLRLMQKLKNLKDDPGFIDAINNCFDDEDDLNGFLKELSEI